jgi:hypothetical protein
VPAHIPAANVTTVNFRNHQGGPGIFGRTPVTPGVGNAAVFNETIELFPAAFLDPHNSLSKRT